MHVEFLPPRYAVRREVRQRNVWRTGVFALFGGVILVSSLLQYYQSSAILTEIERLRPLRESAKAKQLRLATLQLDLTEQQREALLFSYLDFPWPRTRILAEIVQPLPESVTLTNFHMRREQLTGAGLRRRRKQKAQDKQENAPKATKDLAAIRTASESHQTTVALHGVTVNVVELHEYVEQLRRSPLFDRAELDSLQSVAKSHSSDSSEFRIRVVIRPGHGQSRGLWKNPAEVAGSPQARRAEG